MTNLAFRERREEQMDDPSLDPAVYDRVLRDLSRVNRWTLSARPTLKFVKYAVIGAKRFRLLDVGFGQGDMLRSIAHWARSSGVTAELVGVDLNPNSVASATSSTPPELGIRYITGDYAEVPGPFDVVISNLVAHHMSAEQLRRFLDFMESEARWGWLINDLHRHRLAYLGYPVLARLMGVHRIVREDGQLSIARGFRPGEWREILAEAGITEAEVVRRFPFRLCVERLR